MGTKITIRCDKCGGDKFLKPARNAQAHRICAKCGHRFNLDKFLATQREKALKPIEEAMEKLRRSFGK
jgi:DNA-directed RNA polymerase subunit RPC12/RpoP